MRGDRARLALGEEQSSGSRHRLRGDLDGAVLGQAVLETGAGERVNNLEIPGRRARGQGLEHGEIVLVDEDGAAHRIHEGSDGCDLCVGGARGRQGGHGLPDGSRDVRHDAHERDARAEVGGDLVEGAPRRQGDDADVGPADHDGGDLLDDRALVLGLDRQDDDVGLAGQGGV